MAERMRTKKPYESWTDYSKRIEINEINNKHADIIKTIRDSEAEIDYSEHGRKMFFSILIKIISIICLVWFIIWMVK